MKKTIRMHNGKHETEYVTMDFDLSALEEMAGYGIESLKRVHDLDWLDENSVHFLDDLGSEFLVSIKIGLPDVAEPDANGQMAYYRNRYVKMAFDLSEWDNLLEWSDKLKTKDDRDQMNRDLERYGLPYGLSDEAKLSFAKFIMWKIWQLIEDEVKKHGK